MMSCREFQNEMMEQSGGARAVENAVASARQQHAEGCAACSREADEMRRLMQALDSWQAPEPNPYFMTRMTALLDEERRAPQASRLARLRRHLHARLVYGQRWKLQPVMAAAFSVMVVVGGGAYLGFVLPAPQPAPAVITASPAVVQDLVNMDNNAPALDTLENLSSTTD